MAGLRVIAGSAKGRKLRMVPGSDTRPIGDRVKQALFNILGADVQGSRFLDLFAGTGSVGIEALSRGAGEAVFVDASPQAIRTVRANLEHTQLAAKAQVHLGDGFAFVSRAQTRGFDYVYLAPPQYRELWIRALQAVDRAETLLTQDAWVIVQIDPKELAEVPLLRLSLFDRRRYGSTLLCFFELARS